MPEYINPAKNKEAIGHGTSPSRGLNGPIKLVIISRIRCSPNWNKCASNESLFCALNVPANHKLFERGFPPIAGGNQLFDRGYDT